MEQRAPVVPREAPASRSATDPERLRAIARNVIDAVAVGAAVVFIASYFRTGIRPGDPTPALFLDTTTNGGDMGSHVFPAVYLRNVLLPKGQVVGWCPGNYCGYPIFQFYFPLTFLMMAGLSLAIPLAVAFKVVTVLGTFLLPPCVYFGLRLSRVPFPGPALAAVASLCFIFMEANSMWGGNIPSTLAGEFTFSFGMALAVLFLGTLRWTIDTGRGRAWNGLLVALIGLSHGYTLIWAGFTSLTELVTTRGWWRRVGTLAAVHGLGFLLMAGWLVPLLAYAAWTTAYSHVWLLNSWKEVLPPVLWPATLVAVATTLAIGALAIVRREPFPHGLAKIWAGAAIGIFFYYSARALHVVDIRFIPFFQLGLCLAAGAGLGYLLAALPAAEIWPIVGVCTILPFVQMGFPAAWRPVGKPAASAGGPAALARELLSYRGVTFIPDWIRWNYSGYEKKAPWPIFKQLNDHLRGTFRDPRVVFEHSSEHEALGTIRAFENLPLFSGRSTLEGLYMQASETAPFVFYIQSEISKEQSCPFPDWGCSRFDLDRGIQHLRMMNVSHFIVRSEQVKTAAAANPGLTREARIGQYEIYRVNGDDPHYAVPLTSSPLLVVTPRWKEVAYQWFKTATPADPVPVFVDRAPDEDRARFASVGTDLPRNPVRTPLAAPPVLTEHLETDRITVTGCRPGHPILVRISYHPRWRALTGERIWLAGPSFMLVFPRGERVDLVFDGGAPVALGHALSIAGWIVLLLALVAGRRLGPALAAAAEREGSPVRPLLDAIRATGAWTLRARRRVLAGGLVLAGLACVLVAVQSRASDADSTYRYGQKLYDAGRLRDALPYFRAAERLAPLSNTAVHSTYYESIILYREEDWAEAEKAFQKILDRFPEAQAAAEAQYHVGLCRARRGDRAAAVAAWQATRERYPGTIWATYAGDRLAEVRKAGGA
ncbi:MAG TPA: 6-pyruvoyl-tetrahydropterin synthase-related protein [Candidatus Binatia bacterium]|nr:6-pyruvoyl-tetrahydropterin synthase-related protein [Candidatus Binatia bacterium]